MANATPVHGKKALSKDAEKIKAEVDSSPVAEDKQLMNVEQPEPEAPEVPEVPQQPLAGRPGTRTLPDGTVLVNN